MNLLTIEPMKELNIEGCCVQKCSFFVKKKGGLIVWKQLEKKRDFK